MYRTGHTQLVVRRCPHSLDLLDISRVSFPGSQLWQQHEFKWSDDIEKDFKQLKAEFTAGKIQAYSVFDSKEPFILTTNWSALNIAGVLYQKQEGVERFISNWGRKCNRYENIIHLWRESYWI